MARPKKNNADYFSHDADMRNDPKLKALRRKYGLEGYAIWCFLLEVLTDADFFEYEWSELNIELLAGDFDIDPEMLKDIAQYLEKLQLLTVDENGIMRCFRLVERFEPLLSKRKRDRNRVFDSENPQSKVKESKVKESKVNIEEEISIYQFSKQQIEKQEKGDPVDEFLLAVSHIYKLMHEKHGEILLSSFDFIKPIRELVESKKITDFREMWHVCEWAMNDDFWAKALTDSRTFANKYHTLLIKYRKS